MTRARAQYEITAKDKTDKAVDSVKRNLKSVDDAADSVKLAVGAMGAATGLVMGALATSVARTTITFEKLQASLITVTGSAENAEAAFGALKEFAATTPFQLEEVVQSFIKLKALGLKPSQEALESYGNTAAAMGKSLDQFIEAVADAATGEFERLKEFGIKASSEGDRVRFTFQGITTEIGKNAEEIEGYLKSIGNTQFAGAMELQMDTLGGAVSNLEDSISLLQAAIGEAGLSDALKSAAGYTAQFAKDLTALTNVAGEAESSMQGLRDVFGLLFFGDGSQEELLGRKLEEMDLLLEREKELQSSLNKDGFFSFLKGGAGVQNELDEVRKKIVSTRSEIEQMQDALFNSGKIVSGNDKKQKSSGDPLDVASTVIPTISEKEVEIVTKYWDQHEEGLNNNIPQWEALDEQVIHFSDDLVEAKNKTEELTNVGRELGWTFSSAAEDALTEWKGFGNLLGSIFEDIQRIVLRKAVTEPFGDFIGGLFSGGGEGGGIGGFFKNFLGSFDVGTDYVPRDGFAYIHKGEAIIPAAQNRAGTANGAVGGNVNISINVETGNVNTQGDASNTGFEFGRELASVVTAEVQRQMRPGGILSPV
jgi:hypothetical protein